MGKLANEEIVDRLRKLKDWSQEGGEIQKKYQFPSFLDAMAFVNRVAELAEQADHHPNIVINYRRVTLTLSTHSEGGVTEKDFDLAQRIDAEKSRR